MEHTQLITINEDEDYTFNFNRDGVSSILEYYSLTEDNDSFYINGKISGGGDEYIYIFKKEI
ncbi:hypothetical protein FACS189496_3810 [Bacilli bacterium]|nr:hypothetical protein FACS189496_3810 [Bacilli bacterium]